MKHRAPTWVDRLIGLFDGLDQRLPFAWEHVVGAAGIFLVLAGHYLGLFVSPPERHMQEVVRILYVHVPLAWAALATLTVSLAAAVGYLFTARDEFDWLQESTIEVGTVFFAGAVVLGSIFARPTWGVWWDWDPRLTSSAVMVVTFAGILVMRQALREPDRRATWTAVATTIAWVNVPITYMSVRWWRSLHQIQSSPETLSDPITMILRVNVLAITLIAVYFTVRRWRIARAQAQLEAPPALPEEVLA